MMYDFLVRDKDSERFDELLNVIARKKCIAFVGAGISRPLGYRVWEEGIIQSQSKDPTLIQLANIPLEEVKDKELPDLIDECKGILGERYFDFLVKEFGPVDKERRHLNVTSLWKANFQHYITTNFDQSLYYNREYCENIVTYPSDNLRLLDKRTLYHIHGRAYKLEQESDDTFKHYLTNIVYGRDSYINAYDDQNGNGLIEAFIFEIIRNYSLLFTGFSMSDKDFSTVYEKMNKRWRNALELIAQHPQRITNNQNSHYILLPFPKSSEYSDLKIFEEAVKKFIATESEFEKIQLKVIGYLKNDNFEHYGLNKALEFIMDRAPFAKIKKLMEYGIQTFDSSSASISEVER